MTVISVILDGRKKGEQMEVLLSCPSPGEENTDEFLVKVALNPGASMSRKIGRPVIFPP